MNAWVLVAASLVGCPWSRQVYYYSNCQPVQVYYIPCTPVYTVTPLQAAPSVAVEKVVEAEPAATEQTTEAVAANEEEEASVLENANFVLPPNLSLSDLALGWGVASIGPGTLYPTSYATGQSTGGWWGGTGSDNDFPNNPTPTPIPQCGGCLCDCPKPTPVPTDKPPPQVPEPFSAAIWLMAAAAAFGYRRWNRKDNQPRPNG